MITRWMNRRLGYLTYPIMAALMLTSNHVSNIRKYENEHLPNKEGGNETPIKLKLDGGIRFHPLEVDQIIISKNENGREHILEINVGKSVHNSFVICINGSCVKPEDIFGKNIDVGVVSQNIGFKIGTGYDLEKEFGYKVILGIHIKKESRAICDEYTEQEYGVLVVDFNLNGRVNGRYVACPQSIR